MLDTGVHTHSDTRPVHRPNPARSIDELDDEICALSARLNAETYRLLVLIREFDDRLGWAKWSFKCCSEWFAWRCGLSLSAAREKLRTAHALRGLPVMSKAFARGQLSYSKVRALTRVARRHDEDLLVAYASTATAAQVEERCRQMRNVEPDSTDAARRAWERRSLTIFRNDAAGTMTVSLEVPVADGELVVKAIDRVVASGEAELGPEFESSGWQAQQADAMIAIARSYLAAPAEVAEPCANDDAGASFEAFPPRASSADHYQVVVHVDESALSGGAGRSDLPVETVRRLACDGSLVIIVDDEHGNPMAVSRRQRNVSPALRRALWSRDRGCSFPGCRCRRYVDAHHIDHWAKGGENTLANLTLLCTQHHRLVHEGAYSIDRDVDGAIYFKRPDGRVIPRGGYRLEDRVDDDRFSADDYDIARRFA